MTLGNGGETMGLKELSSRVGGASGRVKIYDKGVYHEPEVAITVISHHFYYTIQLYSFATVV